MLVKTIEAENLAVIEALLDGRRWIDSSRQDACFEAARKKIGTLLESLRELEKSAESEKPTAAAVRKLLNQNSLLKMLNLFPTYFNEQQNEAVNLVLNIAVSAYNHHGGDAELSKSIIGLTHLFTFKSEKSNQRIQENIKAIEEIIQEEKKHEAFLKIEGVSCSIQKDGVHKGNEFISVESIRSVRWGGMVTGYRDSPKNDFLFVFKSICEKEIKFQWTSSTNLKQHKAWNKSFIDATFQYLVPEIMEKLVNKINSQSINIGSCTLTIRGIEFKTKGFIFSKSHFVPWWRVEFDFENGDLVVMDSQETRKRMQLSLRDVDNAFTVRLLKEQMN